MSSSSSVRREKTLSVFVFRYYPLLRRKQLFAIAIVMVIGCCLNLLTTNIDFITRDPEHPQPPPTMRITTSQQVIITQQQQKQQQQRRLEFVHIPKTGGTMMENQAYIKNMFWGKMRERQNYTYRLVEKLPAAPPVRFWHWPPYYYNYLNISNEMNPYYDADLFTIIRNPYHRLISEYYYSHQGQTKKKGQTTTSSSSSSSFENVEQFNKWIKQELKILASVMGNNNRTMLLKLKARKYYKLDGHLIPQYDYVYDFNGNRFIDHIIHYETLQEESTLLMEKYNLSTIINLVPRQVGSFHNLNSNKKLCINNLTESNLNLVNHIYRKDFEEFGYTMLEQV